MQSTPKELATNSPLTTHHSPAPWWREPEVAILIVLVVAAYFVRLGDLTLRGEEMRRALIGYEMMETGDWIVPRVQGDPLLSRPPLQNWVIAASTAIFGSQEAWVLRLHSAIAMLVTTLLIYGYARTCLSRLGALTAAAAFATLGEMFENGNKAETEMLFITLVSASLLLWHWGLVRGWPAMRTWIVSYVLVGLAILCKGPQAPVYFFSSVCVYLLVTGQLRKLFTPAHLVGVLACAAIVLAWAIPCTLMTSWSVMKGIVLNDSTSRFMDWNVLQVLSHLVTFPLEVLGCTMPWSLLLLTFALRDCRRMLGSARPQALFMTLCLALAFPTCWIPPGGQTRYFTPLYPCLAVLVGVVVECCMKADVPIALRNSWGRYVRFVAVAMALFGLGVVLSAIFLGGHAKYGPWAEPLPIALGYALATVVLVILIYRSRQAGDAKKIRVAVLALACFMVLTSTGIMMNVRVRRAEDQAGPVARLVARLPAGHRLYSFGQVDSGFAFYYRQPITPLPLPPAAEDLPLGEDVCFCICANGGHRPELPFPWEELAVIPMDRNHHATPEETVIVGRVRRPSEPPMMESRP
jgi:4-amino-4-deoxy-L-arabinose transferase-like glycosyltransferase